MIEFLNDITTYREHPVEAAIFVIVMVLWGRVVFRWSRAVFSRG